MFHQSLAGRWQFREWASDEWLDAHVPGSVHVDLLALGRIPDPFVGDDELRVQWVAERDWEYRVAFRAEPQLLAEERVFLVCDGLDTLAEVALDGQTLGNTDNAFRQYRWDVTALLAEGGNVLHVLFRSPVLYARAQQEEQPLRGVTMALPGAPFLRKPPCQFGWDWGPMLPPVGAWRDVRLEGYSSARLDDVHLRQRHVGGRVTVSARVTAAHVGQPLRGGPGLRATLSLTAPDGQTQVAEMPLDGLRGELEIDVEAPRPWWPNGCGEQPIYRAEVTLYRGDALCDRRAFQLGLRTIELRRERDAFGESFEFVVNGTPIFAKGANWIPADSFPTRVSDDHLEHLVRSAAQAHMNMLRVWGGGTYEEERFYDLCDRYGILVWQDFAFACSIYPADEPFFENVRGEAVENVRRLRHRASLALWCGNNEMEGGWVHWGWDGPDRRRLKKAYDRMFHHVLPAICAAEDPDTAYWPSSPSSDRPFRDPNGQERGDVHYWGVWHERQPFAAYREQLPRFVSEFGFQSLPPLETVRAYAGEADWNMTSYVMEHHQRCPGGNGLMVAQLAQHFCLPKDFPSLVYLSMVLQAEGIRHGVEHWRRNRHRVSGALYWQLNDCWPVASWSSVDYFGRWKTLHYAARRFFAPVLLSIEDSPPTFGLHVTSDLRDPWEGKVRWSLETLDGQVLKAGEEAVSAPPLHSTHVCTLDLAHVSAADQRRTLLVAELVQGEGRAALAVAAFVPDKHLEIVDPGLAVEVGRAEGGLCFDVSTRSLARFVELRLEGTDVAFSDNYFDLPAGRKARVSCPLPEGWTVDRARQALRVRSLRDSY